MELNQKYKDSPILRYLVGWDHEPISDLLPRPVPIPTPHIPLRNMPTNLSSLISCNSQVVPPDCPSFEPVVDSVRLAGNEEELGKLSI